MNYNPSHESLGKPLKNFIRVIQNIGFTISLKISIITPEKIGATIDKMSHELPIICS